MSEWLPIDTAPRDQLILLYGPLVVLPDNEQLYSDLTRNVRATGGWDCIDDSWSVAGGTWEGPWIEATHWMPLPPPP